MLSPEVKLCHGRPGRFFPHGGRCPSWGTLRAPGQVGASQWVTRSLSDEGGVPPAIRRAIGSLGPSLASQVGNGLGEA